MCPAIVSGIITGDAPVIYCPFFFTNFTEQTQESPSYLTCSFPSIPYSFSFFFVGFVFCLYVFNQYLAFFVTLLKKAHVV